MTPAQWLTVALHLAWLPACAVVACVLVRWKWSA